MFDKITQLFLKFLRGKKSVNPSRRMVVGFGLLILVGAILLMLPISSITRETTPFLTSLFTATSATCVTGLVIVDTGAYYSYFGQAVIITLIQIGGLGFMTILTIAFLASHKNIGIRSRMVMAQSFGLDSISGVVKLSKHVLMSTAVFEISGAVLLSLRFIPQYGFKGIWYSIFHSISAFCNAGFDIFGTGNSIMNYKNDPLVILVISALIIIGGIGFMIWEDIYAKKSYKRLSMYSRIVIITTAILLIFGTLGFFFFEYKNPTTIGDDFFLSKILSSFFQSVTCRTAGFDSIGQSMMTEQSKMWSIILMMIGGASGSTAGGVKVGTIAIAVLTLSSVLKSQHKVIVMGRTISPKNVNYALSLLAIWICLVLGAGIIISTIDKLPILDVMYEVSSAYGTVGLTNGVTEHTSIISKCILILYMFLGRVGLMTVSITFMTNSAKEDIVEYPVGNVLIG